MTRERWTTGQIAAFVAAVALMAALLLARGADACWHCIRVTGEGGVAEWECSNHEDGWSYNPCECDVTTKCSLFGCWQTCEDSGACQTCDDGGFLPKSTALPTPIPDALKGAVGTMLVDPSRDLIATLLSTTEPQDGEGSIGFSDRHLYYHWDGVRLVVREGDRVQAVNADGSSVSVLACAELVPHGLAALVACLEVN